MPSKILAVAVAAMLAAAAPAAKSETLGTETRTMIVKYKNGMKEKYVVQWTATMDVALSESGGPAIPFQGKFVDDRRCHWNINAYVMRRVYLANQNGELFEKKDLATPFSSKFNNEGSGFVLTQLRPENCGDARLRYESDLNDSRIAVRRNLPVAVRNDLTEVLVIMKAGPNVKEVVGG